MGFASQPGKQVEDIRLQAVHTSRLTEPLIVSVRGPVGGLRGHLPEVRVNGLIGLPDGIAARVESEHIQVPLAGKGCSAGVEDLARSAVKGPGDKGDEFVEQIQLHNQALARGNAAI